MKEALLKATDEFETLDNHELVITVDLMDVIEPGTTYKGLSVVLGKEVHVRQRKSAPVKPTIDPRSANSKLLYIFRSNKGKPFFADQRKAWRYITQSGEWKYTPQYLGAVSEDQYLKAFKPVQEKIDEKADRLRDLVTMSNADGEKMSAALKKEMREIIERNRQLEEAFMAEFATTADPTIRPKGSDLVQVFAKTDGTVRGNPDQIVRGSLGV